ncbi:hypothetical protein [Alkalihalobacillus pseudalcaliphilus]|nr:hypothetical protein [Alkalihalobacillus pseudalcaliphilus]
MSLSFIAIFMILGVVFICSIGMAYTLLYVAQKDKNDQNMQL